MQLILLGDIIFYYGGVAFVEIRQYLEEFLVGLVDSSYQVGQFVLLEILIEGFQAVLHELVDLNRVMILVISMDGQTDGTDEAAIFAVSINADEGGVLSVSVAVVRLDEFLEALGELLDLYFNRHILNKYGQQFYKSKHIKFHFCLYSTIQNYAASESQQFLNKKSPFMLSVLFLLFQYQFYYFILQYIGRMSCLFGKSSKTKKFKENQYVEPMHEDQSTQSDKKATLHDKKCFKIQRFNCSPYQLYTKNIQFNTNSLILERITIKNEYKKMSLTNIDFPVLSCSINQLLTHAKQIIMEESSIKAQAGKFNIDMLLIKIAESYKNNSYHNFAHAFSTLLLLYQSYKLSKTLQSLFTPREWLFMFIAALTHDISHPGTNNDYENKLKTKCSIQSGKEAVLQKFHLSFLWTLLQNNSEVNFLQAFDAKTASQIKKLITRLILSTDMAKHNEKVDNIKHIAKNAGKLSHQQSLIVAESIFHACDVGNPCLNFDNYNNWAILIASQFNVIAQSQASMGFQVNKLLKFQGWNKFYKDQKGFCNFVVLPLWRQINCMFGQLCVFTTNIESNIKQLQEQQQKAKRNCDE